MSLINLLDEDLFLWDEFRNGAQDAFAELMKAHYRDLFSYGTRFTSDDKVVKRAIRDLFLEAWEKRRTAAQFTFFKYYLFKGLRIRLTGTTNRSGKGQSRSGLRFESLFNGTLYPRERFGNQHYRGDLVRKMRQMLLGLTLEQQEILYLRFNIEAEIEDIAEIMSLDRQPVYELLQDALKRLKKTTGAV